MPEGVDKRRRRFLTAAASVTGGAGVVALAWPFVSSMSPSARAEAAAAPVEVNIGAMEFGQLIKVAWRSRPVWIVRRSERMLESLDKIEDRLADPKSTVSTQQPAFATNQYRSLRPEYLVLVGICTHLGCSPLFKPETGSVSPNWAGGFYCPCHGSRFDLAGRVFEGVPAPTNLEVPPYRFLSETTIVIGETGGAA